MSESGKRECFRCKIKKAPEEFRRDAGRKSGREGICKECRLSCYSSSRAKKRDQKTKQSYPKVNDIVKNPVWRSKAELSARERAAEAIY